MDYTKQDIERHIKTHAEMLYMDSSPIATLTSFLRSDGKMNLKNIVKNKG